MQLKHLIYLLAFLFINSCIFKPEGEFLNDAQEPDEIPQITVDLNFVTDTVIVERYGSLRFNFITDNLDVHYVKFYVDNVLVGTSLESHQGFFSFSVSDGISSGNHEMKLEAFTSSGSGSIADGLGMEGFLFSNSWILIVQDWSYGLNVTSIAPDNGSLKISWEEFKSFDFKNYVVLKSNFDGSWPFDTVAIITDQSVTSVYDNAYIGERVYYEVNVNNLYDTYYYSQGLEYEDTVPQITIISVNNHYMTVGWNESKFINNISGYEIYVRNNYDSQYEMVAELDNSDEFSYVLDSLDFAVDLDVLLITLPNEMPSYIDGLTDKEYNYGSHTEGRIGDYYGGGDVLTPIGDYIYYKKLSKIYEYNFKSAEITDSIEGCTSSGTIYYFYSVSPNRVYSVMNNVSNEIIVYNFNTGQTKSFTEEEISGNSVGLGYPVISDVGIAVFSKSDNIALVYDFVNDVKIFEGELYALNTGFKISADGNYFCKTNGRQLYEIQTDTIVEIWKDAVEINESYYFEFDPVNPELIILRNGNYINKRYLSDLSVAESYHIPNFNLINIDYNENLAFGAYDNCFLLYDLNSLQQIWSYPTYTDFGLGFLYLRYWYNAIYDGVSHLKLTNEQL